MSKWKSNSIIIFLFLIFAAVILYYISSNPQLPQRNHPLIHFDMEYLTSKEVNLTQNNPFILNFTISSSAEKKLVIPLSLELFSVFRDGVQEVHPEISGYDNLFNPNPLIVEPSGSNSTLLTATFFSDAEVVEYDFHLRTGNSEEHHVGGTGFRVNVVS